jgi:arginine/lysine/ornithine decarboxylase
LRAFQTSSPSFFLAASLDYAREYMEERGAAELDRILDRCELFYSEMSDAGYGIPCDIYDMDSAPPRYSRDMTRLVVDTADIGLSGVDASSLLWSRYNIKAEMADPRHIVMIATVADGDEDFRALTDALKEISIEFRNGHRQEHMAPESHARRHISTQSPQAGKPEGRYVANPECFGSQAGAIPDFITHLHTTRQAIPLALSEGKTAAEMVTPYPPGIPLLCPGEKFTLGIIDEIRTLLEAGVCVKGVAPGTLGEGRPESAAVEIYDVETSDAGINAAGINAAGINAVETFDADTFDAGINDDG